MQIKINLDSLDSLKIKEFVKMRRLLQEMVLDITKLIKASEHGWVREKMEKVKKELEFEINTCNSEMKVVIYDAYVRQLDGKV